MNLFAKQRRSGISSLYMMFMFIAASLVAIGLIERQKLELIRTSDFINDQQAMEYAYGAEAYSKQLLFDYIKNRDINDHENPWIIVHPPFAIPQGSIAITLEDAGGKFNINSLLSEDKNADTYFVNLCSEFNIDATKVQTLLSNLIQAKGTLVSMASMSTNTNILNSQPWLADASELVDYGLPEASYSKLAPYLVALPESTYYINVNSASVPVLKAYSLNDAQINAIQNMMSTNGNISATDFGALKINDLAQNLRTVSYVFTMHVKVKLNEKTVQLNSTLMYERNKQGIIQIITLARTWGNP